jgi:hypothetical protein
MNVKKQCLVLVLVSLVAFSSTNIHAQCFRDSPDCVFCFDPTGIWNPTGDLLEVALQTRNTIESCIPDGGKPFYQMQMGISDVGLAQKAALALYFTGRSPWCTETVAYWHMRARSPYLGGYSTPWHFSWQLKNTSKIRIWYLVESSIGGRGRWIDAKALDLNNFQPGVNAPCPGAYMQIETYNPFLDSWGGAFTAHSQVVDWMIIEHHPDGTVINFHLGIIEGNSKARVRNDRKYLSAPRFTPQGGTNPDTDFIGGGFPKGFRKIKGWGIDLTASGEPICYEDRIFYEEVPLDIPPPFPDFAPQPVEIDKADRAVLKKNLDFAWAVAHDGGPTVKFGDGPYMVSEQPSPREPWVVEEELFDMDLASVYIKYPKPLPDPVGMVEIRFTGPNIPEKVTVEAKEYGRKDLPGHPHGKVRNREASVDLTEGMPTAILVFKKGIVARKFRIDLKRRPTEIDGPVKIANLYFHAWLDPKDEDSDNNE